MASLRKAVQIMKQRDSLDPASREFRTSWRYWGNIHGYFGPEAKRRTKESFIASLKQRGIWRPGDERFFEGIPDQTPPDDVAKRVWDQCPHGSPAFFPWHRMYLLYFERVLRSAAGDDSLTLPYWDYTDPKQVALPAEFTQPTYTDEQGRVVPNPLYEARRASQQISLDPQATDIDDALDEGGFDGFWPDIEQGVHGYVHCTVNRCPIPFMGAVAVSSNDPIFWLHHANIDRTWSCWLAAGHQNPGGDFLEASFSFVDQTGAQVTHRVKELFGPDSIVDYTYDHETNCARARQEPVARASADTLMAASTTKSGTSAPPQAAKPEVIGRVRKEIRITRPVSKETLDLPERGAQTMRLKSTLAMPAEQAPGDVELVLDGIDYDAHPGTMFHVFLERKDDPTKREHVGTLSFFGAPLFDGDEAHHHHDTMSSRRVFDVTDELRALLGPHMSIQDVNVVFEATTGQAGSRPENAAEALNTKANLRVKKAELHLKPASR